MSIFFWTGTPAENTSLKIDIVSELGFCFGRPIFRDYASFSEVDFERGDKPF